MTQDTQSQGFNLYTAIVGGLQFSLLFLVSSLLLGYSFTLSSTLGTIAGVAGALLVGWWYGSPAGTAEERDSEGESDGDGETENLEAEVPEGEGAAHSGGDIIPLGDESERVLVVVEEAPPPEEETQSLSFLAVLFENVRASLLGAIQPVGGLSEKPHRLQQRRWPEKSMDEGLISERMEPEDPNAKGKI